MKSAGVIGATGATLGAEDTAEDGRADRGTQGVAIGISIASVGSIDLMLLGIVGVFPIPGL